jgi:nitroimidazol reductase NimA-like FMN-containing flavoprotein (pyridoxamine 5'-phosphate oxidase superfamily)
MSIEATARLLSVDPDRGGVAMPEAPEPNLIASVEILNRDECLDLLATGSVARVGLLVDGRPEVLPVNYAIDGDQILFRTAEGSVLNQASLAVVAVEVDRVDEEAHTGWSVLVQGVAHDIGDAVDATSERLRRLTLVTWAPGARQFWFRVDPDKITGRRIRVTPDSL